MLELNVEINSQEKKTYPICIGAGASEKAKELLGQYKAKKILVVTNETIFELYEDKLPEIFGSLDALVEYCILPDGEVYKNHNELEKILTCAFEAKLERSDVFVAFGGGVIGDITGFAASIYLRGVKFVQIPTTILAQVDSSVGGKVAVNTPYGKNLVGAFYQPKVVISDLNFLKTLPKREVLTGLSEVVKYSFIEKNSGVEFSDFGKFLYENVSSILKLDVETLEKVISKCCELKAAVVNQDEKEKGLRAILNFGHTIAHAIEKVTQYSIFTHGEAVAIGMRAIFKISLKLGKISSEYYDFANNLLDVYGFDYKVPNVVSPQSLLEALSYDKKVQNGKVRFVLPVEYGKVEVLDDISSELILDVIKELY